MLFMARHGRPAMFGGDYTTAAMGGTGKMVSAKSACGYIEGEAYPDWDMADLGPFAYMFPNADEAPSGAGRVEALSKLADAMIEQNPNGPDESGIPAIYTYVGQFIDHDITANTDREGNVSRIDVETLEVLARDTVTSQLGNLRTGKLDLDSVYGGAALMGSFAEKLQKEMRHPRWTAKLRVGVALTTSLPRVEPPSDTAKFKDRAADLPRLGILLDNGTFDEADIETLPEDMADHFMADTDGDEVKDTVNAATPIIGDGRNDENLAVAQFHTGMLRFHNRIVDFAHTINGPSTDKGDTAYEFARKEMRKHYQWLVVNDYLPRVCDNVVLQEVIANGAPIYSAFLKELRDSGKLPADRLPLPLEFSVSAFRYGHSMARPSYDWSKVFGRGSDALIPRASFNLLFTFTGHPFVDHTQTPPRFVGPFGGQGTRLPWHWIADFERLTDESGTFPDRSTRGINTVIAPPLGNMRNEGAGHFARMKHLAERNLRRDMHLNIPTAQACIASMAGTVDITALTASELEQGPGGDVLKAFGMLDHTPLWYYVLREAEVQTGGRSLGQLGSRIVAETLVGLIVCDPGSYWHAPGSDRGRWWPEDGVKPKGEAITTIRKMLQAADFHV